jgi:threonyl-tRNA synthetase
LERFLSIFIEHHGGLFPLWVAPTQVAIIPVAGAHEDYAKKLEQECSGAGIRVVSMDPSESLGKRIREGEKQKIPYLLVLGDKEVDAKSVTVRNVKTKNQVTVPLEEFMTTVRKDIGERTLELSIG